MWRSLIAICTLFLLISCRSKKPFVDAKTTPSNQFYSEQDIAFIIHFKLNNNAINDTFNNILNQHLEYDNNLSVLGFDLKAENMDSATLAMQHKTVMTALPVKILLSRDDLFKAISASGSLKLIFETTFDIDSSFQMTSDTHFKQYEWLEKPRISVGRIKLGIQTIASAFIKLNRQKLEAQIDSSIVQQFDFNNRMNSLIRQIQKPISVDTASDLSLHLRPLSIQLSSFVSDSSYTTGKLKLISRSYIATEDSLTSTAKSNVDFIWSDFKEKTSRFQVALKIGYDKLNELLKARTIGYSFEQDGKFLRVEDVDISKSDEKMLILFRLSGDYNGTVAFSGMPKFNRRKQSFSTSDFDMSFKTRNLFQKTGLWFFRSRMRKHFEEVFNFSINDRMKDFQLLIDDSLSKYLFEGLELDVPIMTMDVGNFELGLETIDMDLELEMGCYAELNDFHFLR